MTLQRDCYCCAKYKSNAGDCTMRFVRQETLKLFVLRRINAIICSECGNGATLNEYYDLIPLDESGILPEIPYN